MVKFIELENGKKLINLWEEAVEACPVNLRISNLIITGTFPVSEIDSVWVNASKETAQLWQSSPCPQKLEFSHGDYINNWKTNSGQSGINFLIEELKQKSDTNRACWSLLNMESLVKNEIDKSIPSFMILQVGFSDKNKILEISTYYRALEVNNFLKINIAEACIVAKKIHEAFTFGFDQFCLTIHAFNAYNDPDFSCLEKAEIDYQSEMQIMLQVSKPRRGKPWILKLLEGKMDLKESRINPQGIDFLLKSMEMYNEDEKRNDTSVVYPDSVIKLLKEISREIERYNQIRATSSYSTESKDIYKKVKENLAKVIQTLNAWN